MALSCITEALTQFGMYNFYLSEREGADARIPDILTQLAKIKTLLDDAVYQAGADPRQALTLVHKAQEILAKIPKIEEELDKKEQGAPVKEARIRFTEALSAALEEEKKEARGIVLDQRPPDHRRRNTAIGVTGLMGVGAGVGFAVAGPVGLAIGAVIGMVVGFAARALYDYFFFTPPREPGLVELMRGDSKVTGEGQAAHVIGVTSAAALISYSSGVKSGPGAVKDEELRELKGPGDKEQKVEAQSAASTRGAR